MILPPLVFPALLFPASTELTLLTTGGQLPARHGFEPRRPGCQPVRPGTLPRRCHRRRQQGKLAHQVPILYRKPYSGAPTRKC